MPITNLVRLQDNVAAHVFYPDVGPIDDARTSVEVIDVYCVVHFSCQFHSPGLISLCRLGRLFDSRIDLTPTVVVGNGNKCTRIPI